MTLDKLDRRDVMAMQSSASEALPGTVGTMMRAMRRAEVRCIRTMDDILTACQKHGGFETRAEARTWLETKSDPKTIARLRKEAMSIKDPDERKLFLNRLDSPAYRYRMKNREAVIQSAKIAVADVRPDMAKTLGVSCSKVYTESELRTAYNVQRTANVGIDFTMVDKYALKQAMDTDYSQVSKYVAEEYGDELAARIQAGILSGESVDKMAKGIEEITDGELWKCKRIARTEMSKAANKGSLDQMEKYGIKRFEFVCTLDIEKTCDVCGNMDGRTYDVADAQPGVNMPPMHPNCRCHIVSYMTNEAKRKLQRTYRDPNTGKPQSVPRDMTYREWMKQYAPEEYAKRYEGLQHTEKMRIDIPVTKMEEGELDIETGFMKGKIDDRHISEMEAILKDAPEDVRGAWNKTSDRLKILDGNFKGDKDGEAYFSPGLNGVKYNAEKNSVDRYAPWDYSSARIKEGETVIYPAYDVAFHELGHNIDRVIGKEKYGYGDVSAMYESSTYKHVNKAGEIEGHSLGSLVEEEVNEQIDQIWKELKDEAVANGLKRSSVTKQRAYNEYKRRLIESNSPEEIMTLSDMVDGATKGRIRIYMGHNDSYWSTETVGNESFAEMYSATVRNGKDLKGIKKYLPKSYSLFREILTKYNEGNL